MAFVRDGILIRTCKMCGITSDLTEFLTQKNGRNGKQYTHNICLPCRRDYNYEVKYKNITKDEHCRRASEWNKNNKERYNARRRNSWILRGISKYGKK